MLVDISSICNGNNSVTIRAFVIENRGETAVLYAQIVACCDSVRVMRDGLNALIVELPRAVDRTSGPDESATRSYKSITKLSVHSIRSAPAYNSRIYIVRV